MARRSQPRQYPRTARVNEVVREVLAEELAQLSDPRLTFVTLTDVSVTPDLRHATVYYSKLGAQGRSPTEEERADAAKGLEAASRHLRAEIGRQMRLKYVPALEFRTDPAVTEGARIEAIIRELHDRPPSSECDQKPEP